MRQQITDSIVIKENVLSPEDFIRMRVEVGRVEVPVEHAKKALDNGLINISAYYKDELVGMGRMVGDGAMYWYLQEIAVLPKYQKMGIGTLIVEYLISYVKANCTTGTFTTIGGVSAAGKEPFYEKLGFEIISTGIVKYIEL